jgi:hypothetical protein
VKEFNFFLISVLKIENEVVKKRVRCLMSNDTHADKNPISKVNSNRNIKEI